MLVPGQPAALAGWGAQIEEWSPNIRAINGDGRII
jgi:hypothetical protein